MKKIVQAWTGISLVQRIVAGLVIGALLGFILMTAVIVIQYLMNDTILKEEDIEKYLGINTLAQLPLVKGAKKRTKKVKRARE